MADRPPVLDYQHPREAPRQTSGFVRVICALLAIPMTLIAAAGLSAGLLDLLQGMSPAGFFIGCIAAFVAYLLWIPVGLRILPRRRPNDPN